ncbi:MAG TPA: CBS domain-containing protein [Gaiellales bacterium]|jgi:CBS domain-containing protein|nr:CBS domain-containing protein [Gaiellales bacterium]
MAVTLRDFMSGGDVLTIEPSVTLSEAARAMRRREVGAAVVTAGGNLVGIFTERDLLRAIADSRHPDQHRVESYMTPDPITLPPDHLPSEAAQIMHDRKFRHIPVVEDGEVIGVVSIRDLVTAGMHIHSADAHVGSDFP